MKIALLMMHGRVHQHVGGAPRIFFDMANYFSQSGHQVLSIYSDENEGLPYYHADASVSLHNLALPKKFKGIKKYKLLREVLRAVDRFPGVNVKFNPVTLQWQKQAGEAIVASLTDFKADVVIAYHVSDLVSLKYSGVTHPKTLVMCHTDPSRIYQNLATYERAAWQQVDAIQVLLPSYRQALKRCVPTAIEVIGNMVPQLRESADLTKKRIVYLARIEKNKRQHLIIEAIHQIAPAVRSGWTVALFGSCNDLIYQQDLEGLIKQYNLQEIVQLMGATSKPFEELQSSSICAFPSAFEGFPLALTEAMSSGLPCVGFSECSGVNELIVDKKTGFLVDDVDDFAVVLGGLMQDHRLRYQVGQAAKVSVLEYSEDVIWGQWEKLIEKGKVYS